MGKWFALCESSDPGSVPMYSLDLQFICDQEYGFLRLFPKAVSAF